MKKIGFAILIFLLFLLFIFSRSSTNGIKDGSGKHIPNSIATMEYVQIGGQKQFMLIRGNDINNPVLLFLHGGPGSPETGLVRKYHGELEKYFTLALWDQRGSGKSFSSTVSPNTMNLEQFLNDTHEVTQYLKKRFNKNKIFMIGHSWGTYLAVQTAARYPEDYFAIVVAGLLVNTIQQEDISYQFLLQISKDLKNESAQKQLEKIGPPVNGYYKNGKKGLITERKLLNQMGGSVFSKEIGPMYMLTMIFPKEYTLWDSFQYIRGINYSIDSFMPVYNHVDLFKEVPEIKIPIYILTGRHDLQTPFTLAEKYFEKLRSPEKRWIWFENSAHLQIFEESDKYIDLMVNTVRKKALHESIK
ncbi:MAG: alpha/beta hydrolase [Spirochaetia bacterium]|nr:alpha/beta hydrolase [Spirochaetia bacterium]